MKQTLVEFIKFGIVGVVGFLVDATVVFMLHEKLGAYGGRIISFLSAVIVTWLLNRSFTFNRHVRNNDWIKEFTKYISGMCVGGGANLLCYTFIMYNATANSKNILIATAIGSIVGMIFNFTLSKFIIFKER